MGDVDNAAIDACPASTRIEVATAPGARLYDLPVHVKALLL